MYGGAFSTLPACLKDLFGSMHVGAIHGRELTACSAAGVAGPVLVNCIRQFQIARHHHREAADQLESIVPEGA